MIPEHVPVAQGRRQFARPQLVHFPSNPQRLTRPFWNLQGGINILSSLAGGAGTPRRYTQGIHVGMVQVAG